MSLQITPIDFAEANAFVESLHRHHKPVAAGYKFCVGVSKKKDVCINCGGSGRSDEFGVFGVCYVCNGNNEERIICGVAIVGLPVARLLCDGFTLEVRRVCTDGTRNACSMLYQAAWRAVKALGYRKLITYTLPEEGGASLRGAGWHLVGQRGGGTWDRPKNGRPRVDLHPTQQKLLWEAA